MPDFRENHNGGRRSRGGLGRREPYFFCGQSHALDSLIAASGQESMSSGNQIALGASTVGAKSLLIIRVDFPDATGQVVSDATLTSLINSMGKHWAEMSFGKMSWVAVGAGSDLTPTVRLPLVYANLARMSSQIQNVPLS